MTAELVPSVSIEALVMRRDAMVERLTQAHALFVQAEELAKGLLGEGEEAWRAGLGLTFGFGSGRHYRAYEFTTAEGLATLVREVDARAWSFLLDKSGLRSFMDAEARSTWDRSIDEKDVPPLTVENITNTFASMHAKRGEMFERGVVAVFRSLSWDYKTNRPQMFGRRLVLTRVCGPYKYGGRGDALDDLHRVMAVLDGKPEPDHRASARRRLDHADWPSAGLEIDGYFSARGYKNGNAHITFLRQDLVDRMNAILAKHHPCALARSPEAEARP